MQCQEPLVSVCIITYKRPGGLRELLESMAKQDFFAEGGFEVVVVDNDVTGSAGSVVDEFRNSAPDLPVVYEVEPVQGIPQARNRSVRLARGSFLAFIDDDETAVPQWLSALYRCLIEYEADAVFGPVEPVLPPNAPAWIRKGSFFDRPRHPTGMVVHTGRTSNALVRKKLLDVFAEPFDLALRFTGGSDSDLFVRLQEGGAVFRWADEATVREVVGTERLNRRWLLMRAFRGGQGYAWRHALQRGFAGRTVHILYRICLIAFASLMTALLLPCGRHRSFWWLRKVYSNAGQVLAFSRYRYEEYRADKYR